jgi:hypothetical protein
MSAVETVDEHLALEEIGFPLIPDLNGVYPYE